MKTCLVVDDSKVIRKVARHILETLDFQVRVIETRSFQRWKRIELQQDGRTVLGWVESYSVPEAMRLD